MRQEACAAAREALPVESTETNAPTPDATIREGEMEGVLHVVGEIGYRAASVRAVLEFSGGHRKQFYDHFDSLEDCFAQAYATWIDRLGTTMLEAAVTADDWRGAVRAGLIALLRFVERRQDLARALFVEVQVAGGAALAKHDEALERLAGLLDSVRADMDPAEAAPESTKFFVVGGVEAALCSALAEGEAGRIWDSLPELMQMIVGSYLDPVAAEEEFETARELLKTDRAGLRGDAR
jgi:AcrR family transcriptional regulator